jgi:hypothetical protein
MKTRVKLMAAAFILSGTMAFAAVTSDDLVAQYRADGYTWIEVKTGLTQIKVEAVKGSEKIEVIYDKETGAVLKRETETASVQDQGRTGVQTDTRSRDFVDGRDSDDASDDNDDDHSGKGNSGHGSDDDGDDDSNDDHGGDDHGGDDGDDDNSGNSSDD